MLPITQERLLPLVSTAVEIWHWCIVQPYVCVCVCVCVCVHAHVCVCSIVLPQSTALSDHLLIPLNMQVELCATSDLTSSTAVDYLTRLQQNSCQHYQPHITS